ncbi:MAG: hypothetical protein AB7U30_09210 [Sulfuricellaceae bacterium]|jgi:hypothetical protein
MPYYVYKVIEGPFKQLEVLNQFEKFREASSWAKARRGEIPAGENYLVKVIFAENELQAEDLLMQVREKEPITGDDW